MDQPNSNFWKQHRSLPSICSRFLSIREQAMTTRHGQKVIAGTSFLELCPVATLLWLQHTEYVSEANESCMLCMSPNHLLFLSWKQSIRWNYEYLRLYIPNYPWAIKWNQCCHYGLNLILYVSLQLSSCQKWICVNWFNVVVINVGNHW